MTVSPSEARAIYVICAVRNASVDYVDRLRGYVAAWREEGHAVHFPPDDAPQNDPTGEQICAVHLDAMRKCTHVYVFWDAESYGSHFDLGMAYALNKKIVPIETKLPDSPGKSYWKVIKRMAA